MLLASTSRHSNTVALCLERNREQLNRPPPLPLTLADNDRARQIVVRPGSLAGRTATIMLGVLLIILQVPVLKLGLMHP